MIAKQLASYGAVGLVQLAADWCIFVALSALGVPVAAANIASRVVGALLGYWLNGRITFATVGRASISLRSMARFAVSWACMTILGSVTIHLVEASAGLKVAWGLKPVIDIALAGLGFIASKYWIYARPGGTSGTGSGDRSS